MAFVLASVVINDEELDEKAWVYDNFDLAKENFLSVISGYAQDIMPLEEGAYSPVNELLDMEEDDYDDDEEDFGSDEDDRKSLEALSQNISKILSGREADQENPCFDYDDGDSDIRCNHSSFQFRYYEQFLRSNAIRMDREDEIYYFDYQDYEQDKAIHIFMKKA